MISAVPAAPAARGGPADVVYLLLLLQVGAGLLGMLGELLFMGNPMYALVPLAKAAAVFVVAAKVVSGRKWALITTIVVEGIGLVGVWLSILVGLLPMLTRTVTLVGLLTEIALPATVIILCARLLWAMPRRPRPGPHRPQPGLPPGPHGVDPWPTAPLTAEWAWPVPPVPPPTGALPSPVTDELHELPANWPRPLPLPPGGSQ